MRLVVPNSQRINRGGLVLTELVETCRNHGFTDIVILHEHRGEPGERAAVGSWGEEGGRLNSESSCGSRLWIALRSLYV